MSFHTRARPRWAAMRAITFVSASVAFCATQFVGAQTPSTNPPPNTSITLSEIYRLALAAQPWQAAQSERAKEQDARARVADSWLADQPSLSSGVRAGNRDSFREYEIEISAPIATGMRRSAQLASARSDAAVYLANLGQQRLKLAGEVREAYWAAQLAATEAQLARDEATRAEQLAGDSARRTAAGESARVDTLQAQTAVQTAKANVIEAEAKLEAAKQSLRAIAGDASLRGLSNQSEVRATISGTRPELREHPTSLLATASIAAARAKLNEASSVTNAAPSVSFTLANERSAGSANATTARIGVSIPFGGAPRAAPRIAQANADLIEAQASEPLVQQQLRAEAESAQRALAAAEKRVETLAERARLADEVAALYARAYRLGELDLPTRLRAEGERANAALALARAQVEQKHAISRVNQSLGILP
jgi:outer membrane protein, heavy metal efflux system